MEAADVYDHVVERFSHAPEPEVMERRLPQPPEPDHAGGLSASVLPGRKGTTAPSPNQAFSGDPYLDNSSQ